MINRNYRNVLAESLLAFALLVACRAPTLPPGSDLRKFDSSKWKSVGYGTSTVRQEMLADLVQNVLPGKSEAEVMALLGQPEPSSTTNSDGESIFYLGPERGSYFGNIDSEWLTVRFDEKRRFRSYNIRKG